MLTFQVSWAPDCSPKSMRAAADGWLPGMIETKTGAEGEQTSRVQWTRHSLLTAFHLMRVGWHWTSEDGDSIVGSWARATAARATATMAFPNMLVIKQRKRVVVKTVESVAAQTKVKG